MKNVHGVDVYFLSGDHILKNSRIEVHGNNSPLRIRALTPAHAADYPSWDRCRVEIDNVIFDGSGLPADGSSRVFVEDRSSLVIKGSKLNKMTIVVENDAAAEIRQSALAGGPAYGIEIRPKGKWQADKNFYELGSIKIGETVYDANSFSDYQKATGQDKSSNWNK